MNDESPVTFEDLAAIEPLLDNLVTDLRRIKLRAEGDDAYCLHIAYRKGYGGMAPVRQRHNSLVGCHASNPQVRSSKAWESVLRKINAMLPSCPQHCSCKGNPASPPADMPN